MAPLYVLIGATGAVLLGAAATTRSLTGHWTTALRGGLAAMFTLTGITHFVLLRDDLVAMVPPALPAPGLLVTVTGVLELAGAAGLLWRPTARWSAAGLAGLLVAVFPANVHAALSGAGIDGEPPTPLGARTVLQLVFLAATVAVWAALSRGRQRGAGSGVRSPDPVPTP
ncbi:DoxX family protein [Modestobacter sp. URMC 112]